MKRKTKYSKAAAALLCSTMLFACSPDAESVKENSTQTETVNTETVEEISSEISQKVTYNEEDYDSSWEDKNPTVIELTGSSANVNSSAAVIVSNSTITIKAAGVYALSGELENGQVVIDAEDKGTVQLVLNGAEINSSESSAIYVKNAQKTILTLAEGTENTVSDGTQYVNTDSEDEPNAAVFSKDDLTINGSGQLTVQGNYNNGITSKDELRMMEGTINITAVDDGVLGRDFVALKEGKVTIDAGGDGMKSSNDEDASKGFIMLEGGSMNITASSDGMQAETSLYAVGGSYDITSGGGSPDSIANRGNQRGSWTNETTAVSDTDSGKGLKAAGELAILGGTFTIDAADDALHSNDTLTIGGGEFTIASGDDGIHADALIETAGGNITITKSYEGIESQQITIAAGTINVTASDDGINVGGGNDGSGMDMMSSGSGTLTINGGNVTVNASGDGLDSNGSIYMTDGTVIVNGPTDNGNGPLDYDGTFEISGGLIIAAGSAGMAQAASEQSTQSSILMTYPQTQEAGTLVYLEDSEGNTVAAFTPAKSYQSVFISSPNLKKDTDYTLYSGGSFSGSSTNGLSTEGEYTNGTKLIDFTITDSVTWLNESGVTTGRSSGPGGNFQGGGQRPEGGSPEGFSGERPARPEQGSMMQQ
ncbi:carbohydrate-binding domain-containing protein [Bacillus taeanensis]|uniref:Dockerin type 1 n=1 Tax=Bacillus taeanensis TaxID=273032 RepID=A0A366Y143_9BACI|nr:carbohydrate-binding domain-containing protein [Bacillus taeanensis]RBW70133.1 dockerin type 1 [Bacillus taeanensis]